MKSRPRLFFVVCVWLVGASIGMLSQLSAFGQGYAVQWGGAKAATVGESHARGLADVIRSQSQANYTNAQAVGSLQDAQSKYLNNRALASQTYMANRRLYDQYRKEKQDASQSKLTAYLQRGKLAPLTQSELYPDTGSISWPPILSQGKYAETRTEIDKAFVKRATTGSLSSEEFMKVSLSLNEWRRSLAGPSAPFSPSNVREAAQLLNRLDKAIKADFQ